MGSQSKRIAAVFDLDFTLTKYDTYLFFLFTVLRSDPIRVFRALWLPIAVGMHYCKLRDNSWLKKKFLSAIAGGARRNQIESWAQKFFVRLSTAGLRPEALEAIERHRASGHYLVLATASFDFYVYQLAKHLGFDSVICTKSVWDEQDCLRGEIDGYNCYGPHKLTKLADYFGIKRGEWHIVAYSDHHSDLPMLKWADESYAVNPTHKLRAEAKNLKISILDWNTFGPAKH